MNSSKDSTNTLEIKGKRENNSTESEYFRLRIREELQLTDEDICVKVNYPDEPGKYQKVPCVCDYEGNIRFNYNSPEGKVHLYNNSNGKPREYERTRLAVPITDKDGKPQKYKQAYQSGLYPFLPPGIITKYKNGTEIDTLFIPEGEFKALAGEKHTGLDFVAIPGINSYSEKNSNKLLPDILKIIERCKVKNLVLLFDADFRDISSDLGKDLTSRPAGFLNSIRRFYEVATNHVNSVYFAHIKENIEGKGLDDIIISSIKNKTAGNIAIIKEELQLLAEGNQEERKFIICFSLSQKSPYFFDKYFYCSDKEEFYDRHKSKIGENEFIYKKQKYVFDAEKEKVTFVGYPEALWYVRIDNLFFKKCFSYDADGFLVESLQQRNVGIIKMDHWNTFPKHIEGFDMFFCEPDHTENFKQTKTIVEDGITTKLYNKYYRLKHKPAPGKWPLIEKLLRHIGSAKNTKGEPMYEFLLDCMKLTYLQPKRKKHPLVLVSTERGTGKSSFLDLNRAIYGHNCRILGQSQLESRFNASISGKVVIGYDESEIGNDPKVINKLKHLATDKYAEIEYKGIDSKEEEFFAWFILCTNNEFDFMKIDEEETRFVVIKVEKLEKPDIRLKYEMLKEIPHFLQFLIERPYYYPDADRLYHSFDVCDTIARQRIMERTRNPLERELELFIEERFLSLGNTIIDEEKKLYYTLSLLFEQLSKSLKNLKRTDLSDLLKGKYNMTTEPNHKYTSYVPTVDLEDGHTYYRLDKSKASTPFCFDAKRWLSESDYKKAFDQDHPEPEISKQLRLQEKK